MAFSKKKTGSAIVPVLATMSNILVLGNEPFDNHRNINKVIIAIPIKAAGFLAGTDPLSIIL